MYALYMKWLIHFCNAIGSIHMWHDIFVHLTWAIHQWHDPLLNTNPPHWFPDPCTCTRNARITMIWHIGNTAMCCWSKPDTSQIWGLHIKLTSSYQNTFQVVNIYLPNVIPTNASIMVAWVEPNSILKMLVISLPYFISPTQPLQFDAIWKFCLMVNLDTTCWTAYFPLKQTFEF